MNMQKLVIVYQVGDDCTWSAEKVVPVEYESVAALTEKFTEWADVACAASLVEHKWISSEHLVIGKHRFEIGNFTYRAGDHAREYLYKVEMPDIYELDEWFEKCKA
jgi:hypothetical protein